MCCCCANAKWKREEVPDHKFDFIDVHDFRSTTCGARFGYFWFYVMLAKSFAVYLADLYTAIALLASDYWAGTILQSEAAQDSNTVQVPFTIGKWIFTGCIIFSFLLLLWEARKARAIVRSRDISYAFTNVMSQNYYSMKSYDYFCLFRQINSSKKKKDDISFFIFFTFKGWKRLLLADAPRQVINAITLYSFGTALHWTTDISAYYDGSVFKAGILVTMIFTVVVWVVSALLLLAAALMYVPLLCYIQGNLKEYCCHKVDKRIADLMKQKSRRRRRQEEQMMRREARGDFAHLRDKKGNLVKRPMPRPTLPNVSLAYGAPSEDGRRYPPPRSDYAKSIASTDGFAAKGMPMGMQSTTSLVTQLHGAPDFPPAYPPLGPSAPAPPPAMAPSWSGSSFDEKATYGGGWSGGRSSDGTTQPEKKEYIAPVFPPHQDDLAPAAAAYTAPNRARLYELAVRQNTTSTNASSAGSRHRRRPSGNSAGNTGAYAPYPAAPSSRAGTPRLGGVDGDGWEEQRGWHHYGGGGGGY